MPEPVDLPNCVDLMVCVTCQRGDERPGRQMHDALESLLQQRADIRLSPVECFAVCKRPCTVAVSQPGKWLYLIGDLDPQRDASALLQYVETYAVSEHGTPPFYERPEVIRRGTLARIPPQPCKESHA